MIIEWNKVTWYSKLGALIVFIVVIPFLTFVIKNEYEKTIEVLDASSSLTETQYRSTGTRNVASINSGIIGKMIPPTTCAQSSTGPCSPEMLIAPLVVKNSKGLVVTHTIPRKDGKFLLLLPPDTYKIEEVKNKKTTEVTVVPETIIPADLAL